MASSPANPRLPVCNCGCAGIVGTRRRESVAIVETARRAAPAMEKEKAIKLTMFGIANSLRTQGADELRRRGRGM